MPVYACLYLPPTQNKAKPSQDSVANTIQGDTKVTERCSCFLHEVPSIKYQTIHYSHTTNYPFPIQLSGSWFILGGLWVNRGTKEASVLDVSKQESTSNPQEYALKNPGFKKAPTTHLHIIFNYP